MQGPITDIFEVLLIAAVVGIILKMLDLDELAKLAFVVVYLAAILLAFIQFGILALFALILLGLAAAGGSS